jgi:hypothetical protein
MFMQSFQTSNSVPTTIGGLLAMDRNYYWKLGGYDDGMVKQLAGSLTFNIGI